MKKFMIQLAPASAVRVLLPSALSAQRKGGGSGPGNRYHRLHDLKTVETTRGEVVSARQWPQPRRNDIGNDMPRAASVVKV